MAATGAAAIQRRSAKRFLTVEAGRQLFDSVRVIGFGSLALLEIRAMVRKGQQAGYSFQTIVTEHQRAGCRATDPASARTTAILFALGSCF
jgi:hypothetical protein